jgi:hypothetical protein
MARSKIADFWPIQQQFNAALPILFHMDSICPRGGAMLKIKNATLPMKNGKTVQGVSQSFVHESSFI